jgi:hypothetical protein
MRWPTLHTTPDLAKFARGSEPHGTIWHGRGRYAPRPS